MGTIHSPVSKKLYHVSNRSAMLLAWLSKSELDGQEALASEEAVLSS